MAFDPSKFVVQEPKAIPLILLADVSSSMSGEPINMLNQALKEMIDTLRSEEKMELYFKVAIITFGGSVHLHTPLTESSKIDLHILQASGNTPMGMALKMAKEMIEDKEILKGRDYRPAVCLLSDGAPTDSYEEPLRAFLSEGRSAKCQRLGVYIGREGGLGEEVLKKFIAGEENPLFYAHEAKDIPNVLRLVTMSQVQRSKSQTPNLGVSVVPILQNDSTQRNLIGNNDISKYLLPEY
ncbi:vWA domain-containing protein [Helicobacter cetorum]|uniref:vWA domain-containing protein n=1 Tax=Helicobacter cetorum TaxID=138563 RepID=UPI000CF0997D|nr:VWA domain-containing protein [Helicobacter cetorum]